MKKTFGIFLLIGFMTSCNHAHLPHIADLPKPSVADSGIILFKEDWYKSTEPTHNILPPHAREEENRVTRLLYAQCAVIDDYQFCYKNDRLNSRLHLMASSKGVEVKADPLGGTIQDVLSQLIGAPPTRLYKIVKYNGETFVLVHSFGVSLFFKGRFCSSVSTNPNSKLFFGIDMSGNPLLFSTAAITNVDRPVEGWKEYSISMCQ